VRLERHGETPAGDVAVDVSLRRVQVVLGRLDLIVSFWCWQRPYRHRWEGTVQYRGGPFDLVWACSAQAQPGQLG
jgi:hypothetical protein